MEVVRTVSDDAVGKEVGISGIHIMFPMKCLIGI